MEVQNTFRLNVLESKYIMTKDGSEESVAKCWSVLKEAGCQGYRVHGPKHCLDGTDDFMVEGLIGVILD